MKFQDDIAFRNIIVAKFQGPKFRIKFPFKRKACQVYRVKYGRGRIW